MSVTVHRQNIQQPVEQQTPGGSTQPDESLWVRNPTGHVWDADDHVELRFQGPLKAGAVLRHTEYLIGDWAHHLIGLSVVAGAEGTVELDPLKRVSTGTARKACIVGPNYERENPDLQPIPGSNGGRGKRHAVRFEVRNAGKKPLRNVVAIAEIRLYTSGTAGAAKETYCPGPLQSAGTNPSVQWSGA